ncbi:MAG: phage major capsid protein [Acidimicrobiia bacterium]|nr:phage major capsid protein [Acidimicrobiia bacterium]
MTFVSNDGASLLRPEDVGTLLVQPVQRASVAMSVSEVIFTDSAEFRVPVVTDDATAGWTPEGEEITPSKPETDEELVKPAKVAGLTIVSRELAEDSSPAAASVIGESLARDIARKIDAAFFGNESPPAPSGLESLADVDDVDGDLDSLDVFAEAIAAAENVGATLGAFVANPADALALAVLKDQDESVRPLLSADPTEPTRRAPYGVPLWVSPAVTAGTIWGIPSGRTMVVVRTDTRIDVSEDAYFSSDRLAVRATMRVGFAFPHEEAIVAINVGGS